MFVVLGLCFIVTILVMLHNKKMIRVHGEKYTAKIYGYVKNTSYMVNGRFPLNVKVHYFDNYGIEREVILPTSISGGADSMFPIGIRSISMNTMVSTVMILLLSVENGSEEKKS